MTLLGDKRRVYFSYNHMVNIHNNTRDPVIRKRCKCGARFKKEFRNSDFNSLLPVYSLTEDIETFNKETNYKKRRTIKQRWKTKPEFKESDWPKLHTETWAIRRYEHMVFEHNLPITTGRKRNLLKGNARSLWKGKFFKESDFSIRRKTRPDRRNYGE